MNPIKTPQEMMYEQAGIPHLAIGGGLPNLSPGATNVLKSTIKKFLTVFGRHPNAEELSQLEAHAAKLSQPTNTAPANLKRLEATTPAQNMMVDASGRAYQPVHNIDQSKRMLAPEEAAGYTSDPFGSTAANFRAREGLYNNDVKAFESRDPFLTEAMTGRAPTRTNQKPFTTSIDDLVQNKAHLENKGIYGDVANVAPGDYPTQSTTPSADYLAHMSSAIEASKLPTNIRSTLRSVLKREPTDDEINAAIANLNAAGHDYTGKGAAIFGERPTSTGARPTKQQAAELADWRQRAIDSGQSRTSVMASPTEIRNRTPGIAEQMDLGPDTGFAHGGSTNPKQMRADMMVHGYAEGGHGILGTNYKPQYNPEATMQATPFMSSEEPFTDYVKGAVSPYLGQMATDRIFGGPQSGDELIYSAAQMANPVTGMLSVADQIPNTYRNLKNKNYLGAGMSAAGLGLGLLPAIKPIKKFFNK